MDRLAQHLAGEQSPASEPRWRELHEEYEKRL
jgi:hypothetical protein